MPIARLAALFTMALVVTGVMGRIAAAQSIPTARKGAEVSAFGGYLASSTDYGPAAKKGIGIGFDFTVFPKFPLAPSLEVRVQDAAGTDVTEKSTMIGLRLQRDVRQIYHPYVDILIGSGEITYHPAPSPDYNSDSTKATSYGGGVNIDVARHIGFKVDLQKQTWNLGANAPQPTSSDGKLTPVTFLLGVTYTVPFRRLR